MKLYRFHLLLLYNFVKQVVILPAAEQNIILYHSTRGNANRTHIQAVGNNNVVLHSPYSVMIKLGAKGLLRKHNTEHRLLVKSLVANHPADFCIVDMAENRGKKKAFKMMDFRFTTEERRGIYHFLVFSTSERLFIL